MFFSGARKQNFAAAGLMLAQLLLVTFWGTRHKIGHFFGGIGHQFFDFP
jgi:hypothetical protein